MSKTRGNHPLTQIVVRFFAFSLAETMALLALAALTFLLGTFPTRAYWGASIYAAVAAFAGVAAAASNSEKWGAWGRGVVLAGGLYLLSTTWWSVDLPTTRLLEMFEPPRQAWIEGEASFPESEYSLRPLPKNHRSDYYQAGHLIWALLVALLAGRAAHQLQ